MEISSPKLNAVRSEALSLTETERAQLVSDLLASLDGPADSDLAMAWDVELCRRINELEANPALVIKLEQVLAQARKRLKDCENATDKT